MNPLPEYIFFDHGTEYRSKAIEEWSRSSGVNLHFIQPGKDARNAFVESLNGKLRNEFLIHN
jgi:putative transposase